MSAPPLYTRSEPYTERSTPVEFDQAGLEVVDCLEPPFTEAQAGSSPAALIFPDATAAAADGLPGMWVWHLERR